MQKLNKKIIMIIIIIIVIIGVVLYLLYNPKNSNSLLEKYIEKSTEIETEYKNDNYTLKVKKIDDNSPDRIIEIYYNNEKIEFKHIKYSDGVIICTNDKPITYYGNITNEEKLIVVLKNNDEIEIKIKEE